MSGRDTTPALGTPGQPGRYRRAVADAPVALHARRFADATWSFLYQRGSNYMRREPEEGPPEGAQAANGSVPAAARHARLERPPAVVQGPVLKPAVWTWEVPLYFWFGGIAAGSSFVALACDLAGDRRSAATARKVALATVAPCPPLLIADLGRPERFLNMLRIFKPRSPMSTGAWCMTAFGNLAGLAVAADLTGRERLARALGGATAVLGGYLGSYTGVLLASTAVPLWSRSRLLLGPIFVSTAAATGAAATRLVLVARGLPEGHPTRNALGRIETGAMATELLLATLNERRLGRLADALEQGRPGWTFRLAKGSVVAGLALRLARRHAGPAAHHLASALYLAGGLGFRYAWVAAGHASATDDEAVAATARGQFPTS